MRPPASLTCRDATEFLASYLGGELTPAERESFDYHLLICRDCRVYLEQYRVTRELSREVRDIDASEAGVPDALVKAILAARARR